MPLIDEPGMRAVRMGEARASMRVDADGTIRLRSLTPLKPYPRSLIDRLDHWADHAPDRTFLADRGPDGAWRRLSFADAAGKSRALGQFLIEAGLSADRPLAILSGNSIEHGLLALGAMTAGIPYAPVSPAYSLVSKDFSRLKHLFGLITPGMAFVADPRGYEAALAAVMEPGMCLLAAADHPGAIRFSDAVATVPGPAAAEANAAVDGDAIAKFLFTSGSTGMPKAVINTHRMLACNQVQIATALAFLEDGPPVLVDWLPWNHTAGGNHNFGIALHNGGTLFIDDGAPTPAGILRTVRNLEEVAPTLYFNVPKGYEMLCEHLAGNARLRGTFFSRLKLLQYAGAGLAQHVWDALEEQARRAIGETVMIITGYGSTETAPFASTTTWKVNRPGEVGLPAAGLDWKLVPSAEKLELRLKGPSVTPGYWRQPDRTAECFDAEGFYRIGDAMRLVDPQDASRGLQFDGRVSEDFKLSTGTWVNMAAVRGAIVKAFAPYVRDAVLTGLDRNHIGAMLFLDLDAARRIAPDLAEADEAAIARHPAALALFRQRLDSLAAGATGSSTLVARALVLTAPPSIDAGELTDKGSINQRAVMAARAGLVEELYAEPPPAHVLAANTGNSR